MAGKLCAKCGKSVGWLSQNKIEGVIYCEDCWKELKQGKKETDNGLKQEKKKATRELRQEKKKATRELRQEKKKAIIDNNKKKFRKKERIILLITAAILTLILLFPPFLTVYKGIEINSGYSFILNPPIPQITDPEIKFASNINIALLFVQYLFTITIGGILWFVFKKGNGVPLRHVDSGESS